MFVSTLGLLVGLIAVGWPANGQSQHPDFRYVQGPGFYAGPSSSTLHPSAAKGGFDALPLYETGSYPFCAGNVIALDTLRELAFVGAGGGVLVVDVSDPMHPVVLSDAIRGRYQAWEIALYGPFVYVAYYSDDDFDNNDQDVQVWDTRDPAHPGHVCDINLPQPALSVEVRDSLLAASCAGEIDLYRLSSNGTPTKLAQMSGGVACDLRFQDTLLYEAVFWQGIVVWNVADPTAPRAVASWGYCESHPHITIDGNRLYLTYFHIMQSEYMGGVWIYDITDPLNGTLAGAYDTTGIYIPGVVAVRDTLAIIAGYGPSISVLSVADPANVREVSTYGNGLCVGVAWHDSIAYVPMGLYVSLIDLSNPAQPSGMSSLNLNRTGNLCIQGNVLYSLGDELWLLDNNPGYDLEAIGSLDPGREATGISVHDTIGVATMWSTGFVELGFGDLAHPKILARETLPGPHPCVYLRDTICYFTTASGLSIYNLAQPGAPALVGTLSESLGGPPVWNGDSLLFIKGERLCVINVADPTHPVLVADTALEAQDLVVRDTFLYALSDTIYGLRVYSVANPAHPRQLGPAVMNVNLPLTLSDSLLVTGYRNYWDGIAAFSIANPVQPVLLGNHQSDFRLYVLQLQHDTLYVVSSVGLYRYQLAVTPTGIDLEPIVAKPVEQLQVWPSLTRGTLYLRGASKATLLDVSGRTAAELVTGENHLRGLAPGVYFVREQVTNRGDPSKPGQVCKIILTK
jgi:hypothetical protein